MGGRNKPWAGRVHIACAMMSAAPMAQTTMSKVTAQSSKAVVAAMTAPLSPPDLALVECGLAGAIIVYDPSSAWLNQ